MNILIIDNLSVISTIKNKKIMLPPGTRSLDIIKRNDSFTILFGNQRTQQHIIILLSNNNNIIIMNACKLTL